MARTRWLSPAEQRTWRAYLRAVQLVKAQLDRELERDAGMPFAYFQILVILSEAPERSLRMSDLAERTWSSRSRLSHAIDRLRDRGWVERVSSPADRRGALARLTHMGFTVLSAAAEKHVASVRHHVFDRLTSEQAQQLGAICACIVQAPASLSCDSAAPSARSAPRRR